MSELNEILDINKRAYAQLVTDIQTMGGLMNLLIEKTDTEIYLLKIHNDTQEQIAGFLEIIAGSITQIEGHTDLINAREMTSMMDIIQLLQKVLKAEHYDKPESISQSE